MIVDIFIRTYDKDLKWLKYCLESIHKFSYGFRDIIICIPFWQQNLLQHLTKEKIVTCPVYKNDYIGQQISKLQAFKYTDAEYIMFLDSDCLMTKKFCPEEYAIFGKPIILKEAYSKFEGQDVMCWKPITENILGFEVEYEYMRRHPFTYRRDTLEELYRYFPCMEEPKELSEFNLIGAYCDKYEKDKYVFIEVGDNSLPEPNLKQYWSHSGLTEQEEQEIQLLLK